MTRRDSVCRSVRRSVGRSVRRSVPVYFFSPKGDLTSVTAPAQRTRLMLSCIRPCSILGNILAATTSRSDPNKQKANLVLTLEKTEDSQEVSFNTDLMQIHALFSRVHAIYKSLFQLVGPSVHLSVRPSIRPSVCPSVHSSVHPSGLAGWAAGLAGWPRGDK